MKNSRATNRRSIRDTRWIRLNEEKSGEVVEHSKLVHAEVDAEEIVKTWPKMSLREKLDIAAAYHAKSEFSRGDQEVLGFIMDCGEDIVWASMASVFARAIEHERVKDFLRQRLIHQPPPLGNFFHAIEILQDPELLPLLHYRFEQYRRAKILPKDSKPTEGIDFVMCCRALWKLTNIEGYKRHIEEFTDASDGLIRVCAVRALSD